MAQAQIPPDEDNVLRNALILYQREEIAIRYEFDNLKNNPLLKQQGLLKGIERVDVDRLKDMFLQHFYPFLEARQRRDESFAVLVKMLWNPKKLARFVPSIPSLVMKYNFQFYPALKTGINAMMAYRLSMMIENSLVNELYALYEGKKKNYPGKEPLPEDIYLKAYRGVPHHEFHKLIDHAGKILEVARHQEIVKISLEILVDVRGALERINNQNNYDGDITAINYGIEMLQTIKEVFKHYSDDKAAQMVSALIAIETNYLDSHHKQKD